MNRKWIILNLIVFAALLLSACGPKATPTEVMPDDAMEEEVMEDMEEEESMEEEDEMMEEEESMDDEDEMMEEEESMDDEDEMMDEEMSGETTTFTLRIENTSSADGLTVLAPGAYELNDHPVAFFSVGEADRGQGLEALAEDGVPGVLVETINQMMADMDGEMMEEESMEEESMDDESMEEESMDDESMEDESMEDESMEKKMTAFQTGVFNTPVGAEEPGPAGPGGAYEFTVEAYPGQYLTFATMFVQSNDWFFAPDEEGIALFTGDGTPLSGDITDQIYLWDAGTEVDQTPGEGADQAPRQAGPDTGEAENGVVERVDSFADYQISVTISPQ